MKKNGGLIKQETAMAPAAASVPEVFGAFRPAYEKYKSQLGKANDRERSSDLISQQSYEHAWLVYFHQPLQGGFVLFRQIGKWEFRDDTAPSRLHRDWTDQAWLNSHDWMGDGSRPSDGLRVPDGGIAKLWVDRPERWRPIGWKDWDCGHARKFDVCYQEFEHGYIIGLLRSRPEYDDPLIFVLVGKDGDQRWFPVGSDLTPPPCDQ